MSFIYIGSDGQMIESCPETLSGSEKMIKIMKGLLCEAIMKNSDRTDKSIS